MSIRRTRNIAATFLLLVMAFNFAAEGCSLYVAHGAAILAAFADAGTIKICAASTARAATQGSCCSAKKAAARAKTCGCPHCGDHCPMGDACTCNHDGTRRMVRSEGLFFRLPGCHPEQDNLDSSYLPLSMRLVFVPALVPVSSLELAHQLPLVSGSQQFTGYLPAPPVPPPKCLAA
jgi:hypothetical protein